jgi:hypothetical protein
LREAGLWVGCGDVEVAHIGCCGGVCGWCGVTILEV